MLNSRSKHTIRCNILMRCIFTVVISESLALFDFSNNPSQFPLTPPVPFPPFPLFSNVGSTLLPQVNTTNSTTVSSVSSLPVSSISSSQSATANFATGFSAPETPIINTVSNTYVETGYLLLQPSTTNSATGSSAIQSADQINSATGFSTSQSATTNFATVSSKSNELATRSPALQTPVSGSGANNIQYPIAANSIVQQFSSSIFQSLMSLEILKNFADFEMEQSKDLFFNYASNVLTNAGIQDRYLAEVVSKALESLGVLSSPIFFTSVANTLAKFLFSKGVLTDGTAPSLSQKFLDLVNFHADSNGVDSAENLVIAVGDAFFEYFFSLGLVNSNEDFEQLFHVFAQELKAFPF